MALMIDRNVGEEIVIIDSSGIEISVFVSRISKFQVKLGVTAPACVKINRREIHDAKVRDGQL